MTYIRHLPSPPLDAYIDDIYYMDGSALYPRQKIFPMPVNQLMINFGQAFQVHDLTPVRPFPACSDSWWVGPWSTAHIVDWPSHVQFLGVHFKPGGAYPFLRFPQVELHNQVVLLDLTWGSYAKEMRERLFTAPTIHAGLDLFERLLLARLDDPLDGQDIVQYAVTEIARQHGALSIRGLSDHIGISQNHLARQFNRMVGLAPKELARLYRLKHILCSIDPGQPVDWTLVAHQPGYYDQSHFNKDFLTLTGFTPSDYLSLSRRVYAENPDYRRISLNLPIG